MSSSSEQDDLEIQEDSSGEEVQSDEAGIVDEDTDDGGESEAGESEAEVSDDDTPAAQAPAIDASDTESDEDDDEEVDDDEDIPPKAKKVAKTSSKMDKITQDVMEKYKKRQGKQLFIRFPARLPDDNAEFEKQVKSLSELIVDVHKPRQKYARFCLVDFATTEDRDITLKKLNKKSDETKVVVSIPRVDSDDFVKSVTEKRLKQIEKRRAQLLIKRANKKALKQKKFTSTIVVLNVPKSASTAQVKELFPDAVDMQFKPAPKKFNGATIATITLPSTAEARANVKRKLKLGGTDLIIRFNNENKKKKNRSKKKQTEDGAEPKKGPLAPTPAVSNGNKKKKNKKNKNKANGTKALEEQVPSKKASVVGGKKKSPKKHKANGAKAVEGQSPSKKPKLQEESKVPQKIAKLVVSEESPKKKVKQKAVDSKFPSKKGKKAGNLKGNKNFPQKQGNAVPNKKGDGMKQNKQKKKPLKKGKAVAV